MTSIAYHDIYSPLSPKSTIMSQSSSLKSTLSITSPSGIVELDITDRIFRDLQNDPALLKLYLSSDGDPNFRYYGKPLIHGMSFDCLKIIQHTAVNPNLQDTYDGSTILHIAAKNPNNADIIHFLVTQFKCSTQVKDYYDCYPFDYAVKVKSSSHILQLLASCIEMTPLRQSMLHFISKMSPSDRELWNDYSMYPMNILSPTQTIRVSSPRSRRHSL